MCMQLDVIMRRLQPPRNHSQPAVDWVLWLDADAVVLRHDMRLEQFLPDALCVDPANRCDATDIHVVASDGGQFALNSGVMLLRNHPWTRAFLRAWRRAGRELAALQGTRPYDTEPALALMHAPMDDAFDRLYLGGGAAGARLARHVALLPAETLNSDATLTVYDSLPPASPAAPFVLHLMATPSLLRAHVFHFLAHLAAAAAGGGGGLGGAGRAESEGGAALATLDRAMLVTCVRNLCVAAAAQRRRNGGGASLAAADRLALARECFTCAEYAPRYQRHELLLATADIGAVHWRSAHAPTPPPPPPPPPMIHLSPSPPPPPPMTGERPAPTRLGACEGTTRGACEGTVLGASEGTTRGACKGTTLDVCEDTTLGACEGDALGASEGDTLGACDGDALGTGGDATPPAPRGDDACTACDVVASAALLRAAETLQRGGGVTHPTHRYAPSWARAHAKMTLS